MGEVIYTYPYYMGNSVDPDQTAPIGAVCSGSTLFVSILNSSVMLGNYLQQTTSADKIFRCIFFLGALRVTVFQNSPQNRDQYYMRMSHLIAQLLKVVKYHQIYLYLLVVPCCLLVPFANNFDPDQAQQNEGLDLDLTV